MIKNILSIAGSDPSGGAGIQADLKTIGALGGYGMAVITGLTAQNTLGVQDVFFPPVDFLRAQIRSVLDDVEVHAIKIGMLGTAEIMYAVHEELENYNGPVVLDPVMVATSGDSLLDDAALEVMRDVMCPCASLLTPNIPEAQKLTRTAIMDLESAAQKLLALGCGAALLKGGHLKGGDCPDVLAWGNQVKIFSADRIDTKNSHGTGCTLSSALAVFMAQGYDLQQSVQQAKEYITGAIRHADDLSVGEGAGPVHHGWGKNIDIIN